MLKPITDLIIRIASEEALDSNGLDTLAELLEHDNQDSSITEHALRALAEITYPKRCKVSLLTWKELFTPALGSNDVFN